MSDSNHSEIALAIETSCAVGEVALAQGDRVVEKIRFQKARAHASEFLPGIEKLCADHGVAASEIRRVYVSVGPGSFTGLRIGVTAARMLALAHGTQIVAVPTLQIVAQNALRIEDSPNEVAVVLDAKRKRVYAAAFGLDGEAYSALTEPAEVDPQSFLESRSARCCVLGEGVLYHRDAIEASGRTVLDDSLFPPLADVVAMIGFAMAQRGEFVAPNRLTPVYIRPPEAEEKWAKRHGNPA